MACVNCNERSNNQGHNRSKLDENVHRRTGSVFERISHGVAGDRSLVGLAAFLVDLPLDDHTLLKTLFGVVPGTARIVLEHAHKHPTHGDARKQTTQSLRTHYKTHKHRGNKCQGSWSNHFSNRCLG